MASSMQQLAASIIERSKVLINNDLKRICKEEGQPQSGNKAVLQARVINVINLAVHRNDADALQRLQYRVQHHGQAPPPIRTSANPYLRQFPSPNGYDMANGYQQSNSPYSQQQAAPQRPQCFFKDSPFFEIREQVMSNITLEASPGHRQNCSRNLILNDAQCARIKSDPTLRLLLFSAIDHQLAQVMRLDITFPSQIEVRINGDEVKANYKGLKNKPGSTRPADITDFVRVQPHYRNNLTVTYALTQKKYNLFVYMVKKHSVADLAKRIHQRNVITTQSVLHEMMKRANDPDIEVGSSVMSLKDPISTLRITQPCRSTLCTHNQCFDTESFLQLQEQAPTWTCPICNKTISFEALAVDEYVQEILNKVPRGTDQVTIQPGGAWSIESDKSPPKKNGIGNRYSASQDDSDDDLVEISDYRVTAIKSEAVPTPLSLSRTPPLPSREPSAPRTGSKRTSEVIDLTLSDDDEPPRPAKKVAYNTPSSLLDLSRRFQSSSHGETPTSMRLQQHSHHSIPSGLRLDFRPPSQPSSHGTYRQPPPPPPQPAQQFPLSHPSYPGHGTSEYPTYLGSSP